MDQDIDSIWTEQVPVFPLPNCILLPGAIQPLQVFEPRYRTMMRDVLQRHPCHRAMAIALLRPGYEPLYATNQAPVHPVVGVGLVMDYREQDDGRFHLLLRGLARANIRVEDTTGAYRKAMLVPRESVPLSDAEQAACARRSVQTLLEQASQWDLWPADATDQLLQMFPCTEMLINVVAFHLVPGEEACLKQRLLEEDCVARRLAMVEQRVQQLIGAQKCASGAPPCFDTWPPQTSFN